MDQEIPLLDQPTEDSTRWLALGAGLLAFSYGLSRRSVAGVGVAAISAPLFYRAIAGEWPAGPLPSWARQDSEPWAEDDTRAALSGSRGLHVRESIRVELPVEAVYRYWRRLEHLPQFMRYLERVTEIDDRRSHWVALGPAGVRVEWDAEIINDVENQVLGWRSLPGADVVTAGSVNFDAVRGHRATQLTVHLQYSPPAGKAGSLVASLFGRAPSQTIREDLRRLKQLLEAGEVARATADA